MGNSRVILSFLFLITISCSSPASATNVTYDGRALVIDEVRRIILSGSIHYPRSTPEMWPDLIKKAKEGGLNAIETYVFWNVHEPRRREYNFEGQYDLVRFIKTIQEAGLYAVLRIGPYVCAEWIYGGLPIWLHRIPGIQIRTDNEIFKYEMKTFTTLIVKMMKKENLLAPQGGPIILTQIENEYGNVMDTYGDNGKKYLQWCANLAESLDVGVPWIMCQQPDAPEPMINTCNGFYCDGFHPNRNNAPKMWTENWTGWFKGWGDKNPHRPAEDVAFAVARFFQESGTFQNYYMYHGGTNFGRTSGGPYVVTSYDYDAPIDEYGNLNQPKWGHLKWLHEALMTMENALTYGERLEFRLLNDNILLTEYALDTEPSACFLSNTNDTEDFTVQFRGTSYHLPAWSVSLLPDCKNVAFNTARVAAQTSVMVMRPSDAAEQLTWLWLPENIMDTLKGKGDFTANRLLEQTTVTGGVSDYLWYTTSVNISKDDPVYTTHMTLFVHTMGHALHAFFNGKHVGSNYAKNGTYEFILRAPISVRADKKNYITLLSVDVGLKNYGAYFDLVPTGIAGGPIMLIGRGGLTKDITNNPWAYKVGLNGEKQQIWADNNLHWKYGSFPIRRRMTWYKTTFKAPGGKDPVVVQLKGLEKGEAWVNGKSIGRFWPTFQASSGCEPCDYRGTYNPSKCANGCGQPSQSWYHVPRSFLEAENNTLILLEEMGGTPLDANFYTTSVGTLCASGYADDKLELECSGGRAISEIQFASSGDVEGSCGSYHVKSQSNAGYVLPLVQQACLGKTSCSIDVTPSLVGNNGGKLTVQASC